MDCQCSLRLSPSSVLDHPKSELEEKMQKIHEDCFSKLRDYVSYQLLLMKELRILEHSISEGLQSEDTLDAACDSTYAKCQPFLQCFAYCPTDYNVRGDEDSLPHHENDVDQSGRLLRPEFPWTTAIRMILSIMQ